MSLVIQLLGSPRFTQDGDRLNLNRRKSIALLAYLAVTRQPQSREALAGLLWPEYDEATARMNLRRDLSLLRKELAGDDPLLVDRLQVEFSPAAAEVDVYQFEQLLGRAEAHHHAGGGLCPECAEWLAAAVALVEGEFMAGFTVTDCPAFDEWLFFQREQRRGEVTAILHRLVDWAGERGQFDQGIDFARRWLVFDPWHEPAHRALMRFYALTGQIAAAIRQYHLCAQVLDEELGLEPEEETEALLAAIQSKEIGPPAGPVPAGLFEVGVEAAPPARHNLPAFADAFVGRRPEIAEIHQRLVESDCRLLTLRGMGGIGKTRLAVQALTELAEGEAFGDGLFMVNLAGVESTDYLMAAVAESLGFSLTEAGDGLEQVANYLGRRELLLFLDNFEQLQSGAAMLARLLQRCPQLKLLVTSRHQLNLAGEHVLVLSGLPVSAGHQGAVHLFAERAKQFAPALDIAAQRATIEEICRLVDGMPLAIEMCAAWTQLLNCREILAEVRQGLDVLEARRADAPSRHLSIRAVFPGSFNLLSPAEQRALLTLAIFRGSFNQAAAREVAGATLGHLRALVEKSLLNAAASAAAAGPGHESGAAETRYQMHPLLRQFALERIEAAALAEGEARYAAYYAGLLGGLAGLRCAPDNDRIVSTVAAEVDNLRAIWAWLGRQVAARPGEVARLLQQMLPAWSYTYLYRTDFLEGRQILSGMWQALEEASWAAGDEDQRTTLAIVAAVLGRFCMELSQFDDVNRLCGLARPVLQPQAEAALAGRDAGARAAGAAAYVSDLLRTWARADMRRADYAAARQKLADSVRLARDDYALGMAEHGVGTLHSFLGEYDQALAHFDLALQAYDRCHQEAPKLTTIAGIGAAYGRQRYFDEAISRYEQVVPLARKLGQRVTLMAALNNLAYCLRVVGRNRRVEALFKDALALSIELGKKRWQSVINIDLGWFFVDQGETEQGAAHIRDGLRLALELDTPADVLAGIHAAARGLAQKGRFEQALVMTGYVRDAGVATAETEMYAAEFWDELTGELPAAVVERAEAALATVSLETLLGLALGE
jgi:predicted ATPase/DNA-binding SARP family transcriptional activator